MYPAFPTDFAMRMAHSSGMLPVDKKHLLLQIDRNDEGYEEMLIMHSAIQEFQTLAVSNNFEDSLIAFHGMDINDEQKLALEVIHKSMPAFTKGVVTRKLLEKFNESQDKVLVEIAAMLIDIVNETDDSEKHLKIGNAKKLIVKVTQK